MTKRFLLMHLILLMVATSSGWLLPIATTLADDGKHHHHKTDTVQFSIRSVAHGKWSDPKTWKPPRVPHANDRVMVSRGTVVEYDVEGKEVIRLLQVVGTLDFARDRNTLLNVGVLKVQDSDQCSESGFACDFANTNEAGEPRLPISKDNRLPQLVKTKQLPTLTIGTLDNPIPAKHTATIRMHYLEGMDRKDAPAIACCSARMEIHGSPLSRTWLKLGATAQAGSSTLTLAETVTGWKVGDQLLITATGREGDSGSFRDPSRKRQSEQRRIKAIQGDHLTLDAPLVHQHLGEGEFRGEVANLSRNVVIESADPDGVRGHTVFHRYSQGGISYARFAHLGKEGVLGRYAIHYHLVGDTMRGSQVKGVAIVDSHNRWITIHGTQYLIVRDCIGYGSVGHGYFMEDGTEVYNLLDRNLAVHAYSGRRLPDQVLPFDPNDGAGFWWANGRNTLTRNVATENDEYGFRYDMQSRRNFDAKLSILQPDGSEKLVDVRTIPIWRFDDNECHAEGFYGMVVAANGVSQPDSPIQNERMLAHIKSIDWTAPDSRHPHMIRNLAIWGSHYAFRPHTPSMRIENLRIHNAAYGIYRPAFDNHEYVNLHISDVGSEPFNRGMDDASAQAGKITVDGLTFATGYGNSSTPLVQLSDVNLTGHAETHFRNVTVNRPERLQDRWPLFNRGVGPRVTPITDGVPVYVHDHYGEGRDAKVVSAAAKDLLDDGNKYQSEKGLTGSEARVAEVKDVPWPTLLDIVDDVPPATVITSVRKASRGGWVVSGVTHDNGEITAVEVNGVKSRMTTSQAGVVEWEATIADAAKGSIEALGIDAAGNRERTTHVVAPAM